MENTSLMTLLESDKDRVVEGLNRDRALPAAQASLEKELDRLMFRFAEVCPDAALAESARYILQSVKDTLPMMDVVGEAREWKKEVGAKEDSGMPVSAIGLLVVGVALAIAAAFISGFRFVPVLVGTILSAACCFGAGWLAGKPREKKAAPETLRTEFLVDTDKAWHCLRGGIMMADGQLKAIGEERAAQSIQPAEEGNSEALPSAELELFSELLESAYARQDDSAGEMISSIRYYLHNAHIEVMDYVPERAGWFELLPSSRPGTIRPALISDGRLVKKGLASA